MKYYYITYIVGNGLHFYSGIFSTSREDTLFSDASRYFSKKHDLPICILFMQETTEQDANEWIKQK